MSFSVRTAAKRKAKAESTTAVEMKRKCGTRSLARSLARSLRGRSALPTVAAR
eukprot:COSAG02_NODE_4236_length_5605_cov_5.330004_2_plen_53_part_00